MDKTKYNEFNNLVSMVVEQHLLLWQTTHALLKIDTQLNKYRSVHEDKEKSSEKDLGYFGRIFRNIRNNFDIFSS